MSKIMKTLNHSFIIFSGTIWSSEYRAR